jgi:hypothetical protein
MKYLSIILGLLSIFLFYSCSASTDSRYSEDEKEPDKKEDVTGKDPLLDSEIAEDFDFTPYRTELEIPEKELSLPTYSNNTDIWYGYEEKEPDTASFVKRKVIDKASGYRILILTTDNLEEANNMRSEIYFNTTRKEAYVVFDPPFYKVLVGDFLDYSEAKNFSFKMSQLGYTESRVVNETVNIFE